MKDAARVTLAVVVAGLCLVAGLQLIITDGSRFGRIAFGFLAGLITFGIVDYIRRKPGE